MSRYGFRLPAPSALWFTGSLIGAFAGLGSVAAKLSSTCTGIYSQWFSSLVVISAFVLMSRLEDVEIPYWLIPKREMDENGRYEQNSLNAYYRYVEWCDERVRRRQMTVMVVGALAVIAALFSN